MYEHHRPSRPVGRGLLSLLLCGVLGASAASTASAAPTPAEQPISINDGQYPIVDPSSISRPAVNRFPGFAKDANCQDGWLFIELDDDNATRNLMVELQAEDSKGRTVSRAMEYMGRDVFAVDIADLRFRAATKENPTANAMSVHVTDEAGNYNYLRIDACRGVEGNQATPRFDLGRTSFLPGEAPIDFDNSERTTLPM